MDFVDVIIREFKQRQERNPRYSLRGFAGFLEMSPSVLSKIMGRKRGLSVTVARQIASRLNLSPGDRSFLPAEIIDEDTEIHELPASDFLGPLVVAYLQCYENHSLAAIAEFLEVPEAAVQPCLALLEQSGMIVSAKEKWRVVEENIYFDFSKDMKKAREFFLNYYLDRWKRRAAEEVTVKHQSVLIPVGESDSDILESELRKLAERLCGLFAENGSGKKLHAVLLGAFPLEAKR